jgi:hypothetical protein
MLFSPGASRNMPGPSIGFSEKTRGDCGDPHSPCGSPY